MTVLPRPSATCLGVLPLLLLLLAAPVAAQQPADSIRAAALRDYHGPDRTGKDGALAKAGLDLLLLYHEYRTTPGADSAFTPTVASARVKNGRVGIEAVATDSARALLTDLNALGLTGGVTAGRLVSGWLPIDQIPAMAKLSSLRGLMQSKMQTRGQSSSATPARPAPSEPPAEAAPAPSPPDSPSPPPSNEDDGPDGAALFLLLMSGVLLAVEA